MCDHALDGARDELLVISILHAIAKRLLVRLEALLELLKVHLPVRSWLSMMQGKEAKRNRDYVSLTFPHPHPHLFIFIKKIIT